MGIYGNGREFPHRVNTYIIDIKVRRNYLQSFFFPPPLLSSLAARKFEFPARNLAPSRPPLARDEIREYRYFE